MAATREVDRLTSVWHERLLFVAAALVAVGLATRSELAQSAILGVCGAVASATIAHFGWKRRQRARRIAATRSESSVGRIVERTERGRLIFEFASEGVEPWFTDAWVTAVGTLTAVLLSGVLGGGTGVLHGYVVALFVAMGLRLRAARSDFTRIEAGTGEWLVSSSEGGRGLQRRGRDAILPELTAEALYLWSASAGRIGVLRGELEPSEREWLAQRLTGLVRLSLSVAAPASDRVDEREPDHDRQGE